MKKDNNKDGTEDDYENKNRDGNDDDIRVGTGDECAKARSLLQQISMQEVMYIHLLTQVILHITTAMAAFSSLTA